MYWGWNRGWFSNSDIHFTGDKYDFTLYDVVSNDRQSPFGCDPYFKIDRITIPQYNWRIGNFFNNNSLLSDKNVRMNYSQNNYLIASGMNKKIIDFYDVKGLHNYFT